MWSVVYPHAVKSLAQDTRCVTSHIYRNTKDDKRFARWVLDVAGPFCLLRSGTNHGTRQEQLADTASRLLALPTRFCRIEDAISITVSLTPEDRDRLIQQEYRRVTRRK